MDNVEDRSKHYRKLAASAGGLFLFATSACGSTRVINTEAPPVSVVATPTQMSTPAEWANEGSRIRTSKEKVRASGSSPYGQPENIGDYAFRSNSVDVVGPGSYKLTGVIPAGIKMKGFGVSVPPNAGFKYHFEQFEITDTLAEVTMVVESEDFVSSYKSFYVWIS